jgi:putative sterol carrier protein
MSELTILSLMERMKNAFIPEKAVGYDVKILVELQGEGGGTWVVTIQDQTCTVEKGSVSDPNLIMRGDSQTVLDIFTGKQDGIRAYMQGKLKLVGDMSLAMKMTSLFKLS